MSRISLADALATGADVTPSPSRMNERHVICDGAPNSRKKFYNRPPIKTIHVMTISGNYDSDFSFNSDVFH